MSTAAIGRGALVLSTNYAGLSQGLDQARTRIRSFAADAQASASRVRGQTAGIGQAAAGGAGGLLSGLGAKALAVTAVAAAGVAGVRSAVSELQDIGSVLATGKVFGVDPETFTGMAGVVESTGGAVREFTESLVTMGKLTEDAISGTPVASEAFRKLGVDASAFKTLGVADQFYEVFDAISRIENPVDRARVAMNFFGEDGGKNMLQLIGKTGPELREMAKGFSLTRGEAEKATAANAAVARASSALGMMWRRVVVAMAPVFEAVSHLVSRVVTFVSPAFQAVGAVVGGYFGMVADVYRAVLAPVFDALGRALGGLSPVTEWLTRAWEAFRFVVVEVAGLVGRFLGEVVSFGIAQAQGIAAAVGGWAAEVFGLGQANADAVELVFAGFKLLGAGAGYVWDTIKAGAGVVAQVFGFLLENVEKATGALFAVTDVLKRLPEGARPDWVNGFLAGTDRVRDAVRGAGAGMRAWGAEQAAGFGQSAAAAAGWVDAAEARFRGRAAGATGAGGGGGRPAAEAAAAAAKYAPNTALLAGSKEEFSARIRAEFGASTAQDKQLAEQKRANKLAAQGVDELKRLNDAPKLQIGFVF